MSSSAPVDHPAHPPWTGRTVLRFTGPEGQRYKWDLTERVRGRAHCLLVCADDNARAAALRQVALAAHREGMVASVVEPGSTTSSATEAVVELLRERYEQVVRGQTMRKELQHALLVLDEVPDAAAAEGLRLLVHVGLNVRVHLVLGVKELSATSAVWPVRDGMDRFDL